MFKASVAAWFTARLDEAVRTAGPRYTPEVHVDLPIASEFEAFGRTDRFFDREKARARRIREKLRAFGYSEGAAEPAVDAELAAVSSKVQTVLTAIGAIDVQATGPLPFRAISEQIHAAEEAAGEFSRLLGERERQLEAKAEAESRDTKDTKTRRFSYRSNPFRDRRIRLRRLISELEETRESFVHADKVADSRLMVLRGEGGTGKTHLLCDVARQRISADRPTVLLMGAALLRRRIFRLFIGVFCSRTVPSVRFARGQAPTGLFSGSQTGLINGAWALRSVPPALPLDIRGAFW